MCYPRIQPLFSKELKICADHVQLRIGALLVGHNAVEVAGIVMTELIIASENELTPTSIIGRLAVAVALIGWERNMVTDESLQKVNEQTPKDPKENCTYPGSWKYLFFELSSLGCIWFRRSPSTNFPFGTTGEAAANAKSDREVMAAACLLNFISNGSSTDLVAKALQL